MPPPPNPTAPDPGAATVPIALYALAAFCIGSGMRGLDALLPVVAHDLEVAVASATGIVAAFALPYGLVQLVAGPLGDRLGKPRVAAVALAGYALATLVASAAPDLPALLGFRAAAGLCGGAVIPLLIAHLGDAVPYAERQGAIARFNTGMVMATLLAAPLGGVLGEAAGWRLPFALLGLGTLGVAAAMTRAEGGVAQLLRPADPGASGGPLAGGLSRYRALLANPAGRRLLGLAFFDGLLLFGGAFPFVGAFLVQELGRSAGEAGAIVAGFGLGALACTRVTHRMVRRFGEARLLAGSGVGLTLGLAGLAFAPVWPVVAALLPVLGFAFSLFHGVLQTRATESLPGARGTAMGGFALSLFLGASAGALAFGAALALTGNYRPAFAAAAAGVLLITVLAKKWAPTPGSVAAEVRA